MNAPGAGAGSRQYATLFSLCPPKKLLWWRYGEIQGLWALRANQEKVELYTSVAMVRGYVNGLGWLLGAEYWSIWLRYLGAGAVFADLWLLHHGEWSVYK